jgi:TatD DNase family protein
MHPDFNDDRPQVMERARDSGIQRILVPGLDQESSRASIALTEKYPEVYAAVGIHPHYAKTWNESTEHDLRTMAGSPKVVAIGEIGLDYYRNLSPPDVQRKVFISQLQIASELELPVIIHNREAIDDVIECLMQWIGHLPQKLVGRVGVLHANSADFERTQFVIEKGFFVGVAGPITYRKAEGLRALLTQLPKERVILETDAPYMPPHPNHGKRNEPAFVKIIAERFAALVGSDIELISNRTSENAEFLFRWNHE